MFEMYKNEHEKFMSSLDLGETDSFTYDAVELLEKVLED